MTAQLKDVYEDLIQDMIINGIEGMTPELKAMIEAAPVEKRRAMILTVLEENNVEHRLLCGKIHQTVSAGDYSEMSHIKGVVGMLREYVKVSKTEVKTHGEVMTPISLVEEMLDTLPYEVWSNPNLKWLDPCNGVGTFMSVVVERLMKGLAGSMPNEKDRYRHIMENMIYVAELQAKNMFLFMYAFDPKDEYSLNVYCGSYLDGEFDRHMKFWGVEKFDVVVMNPPYNSASANRGPGNTLWDKFVIKTIDQLVAGGYLVAVHPDGWRGLGKGFNDVKGLIKSKQMLYLEIHNEKDGLKTFGAETTYDFYCLHNVPCQFNTKIKCQDGTIERADLSKLEFIPNGMFREFQKLIAKEDEEKVEVLYSRSDYGTDKKNIAKVQSEEFRHPVVYVTYKDGSMQLRYSNTDKKGHYGIPKVIWSNGRASSVYIDEKGEYALTEFAYAIVDAPKNLLYIQKAMLNPEFTKLMSFADGNTGHKFKRKAIALFRKDFWKEFI